MATTPHQQSYLLTDLSWVQVEEHLERDSRLIVPVGCCDQFGPHLPIGTATFLAVAFAEQLSAETGVLRAPAVSYGVNLPGARRYCGAATLAEKTLHRTMNDLMASWEDCGFTEFILLTTHTYDPHVEALANVMSARSRVRVIEVLRLDLSEFIQGKAYPAHAGEVTTSLMLHLRPEVVRKEQIEDFYPYGTGSTPPVHLKTLPPDSPGVMGFPSLASAEAGAAIFAHVLQKLRARVMTDRNSPE